MILHRVQLSEGVLSLYSFFGVIYNSQPFRIRDTTLKLPYCFPVHPLHSEKQGYSQSEESAPSMSKFFLLV